MDVGSWVSMAVGVGGLVVGGMGTLTAFLVRMHGEVRSLEARLAGVEAARIEDRRCIERVRDMLVEELRKD